MRSPHGRRGSICAHFGWTAEYLLHGIPWGEVQRMLIDAPRPADPADAQGRDITLTDSNAAHWARILNKRINK